MLRGAVATVGETTDSTVTFALSLVVVSAVSVRVASMVGLEPLARRKKDMALTEGVDGYPGSASEGCAVPAGG